MSVDVDLVRFRSGPPDATVGVHVSNLLRKIGVPDRVQAAAWAEQVGIGGRGA